MGKRDWDKLQERRQRELIRQGVTREQYESGAPLPKRARSKIAQQYDRPIIRPGRTVIEVSPEAAKIVAAETEQDHADAKRVVAEMISTGHVKRKGRTDGGRPLCPGQCTPSAFNGHICGKCGNRMIARHEHKPGDFNPKYCGTCGRPSEDW